MSLSGRFHRLVLLFAALAFVVSACGGATEVADVSVDAPANVASDAETEATESAESAEPSDVAESQAANADENSDSASEPNDDAGPAPTRSSSTSDEQPSVAEVSADVDEDTPDVKVLGFGSLEGQDVVVWFWAEW